jgi:hypothetical protein
MRGLSAAAIGMATVAVLAVPWFFGLGGLRGLGFAGADPSADAADSSPSPSGVPSGSASPEPTPTATAPPVPDLPGMSPSPVTVELSRVLRAAAVRLMPEATFGPTVVAFDGGNRLLAPFDVVDNGAGYYVGWAAISNGSLQGQFGIAIWPSADERKSPNPGCDSAYFPRLGCDSRIGPNGEHITIDMGKWENSETVEYRVKVHRADGTILMATVTSSGQGGYPTPNPASSTPPMTAGQLVELLLTAGLELNLPG